MPRGRDRGPVAQPRALDETRKRRAAAASMLIYGPQFRRGRGGKLEIVPAKDPGPPPSTAADQLVWMQTLRESLLRAGMLE